MQVQASPVPPFLRRGDDAWPSGLQAAAEAAREGRWEAAAAAFDALMPQLEGPEAPRLWSLYALALARTCRLREAASAVRRALQADPVHAGDWALLGELLHAQGDQHEALEALRHATTFDPTNGTAWARRGVVCRVLGRMDEARACGERAVAADPSAPGPWRDLADLLRELGEVEAAIGCYHQLLGVAPAHEDAWCDLVLVHLRRGDVPRARWTWHRAARHGEALAARLCARVEAAQGWPPGEARRHFSIDP
jgi:tetratricopeptide (TPR) repeat protein